MEQATEPKPEQKREQDRIKETTAGSIKNTGKIGGAFARQINPAFIKRRDEIFKTSFERMTEMYSKVEKTPIQITLKDGKVLDGKAFETRPQDIAKQISNKLLDNVFAAKVVYTKKYDLGFGQVVAADEDNESEEEINVDQKEEVKFEILDLHRPLEGDCTLELLDFEDQHGKSTFFHSSAHILGNAIEYIYGAHLCIGPPLKQGFYYDSYMGEEKVHGSSYEKIEKQAMDVLKQKLPFERVLLTKQEALELFADNPFKVQLIQNKVPEGSYTSAYKVGTLIDLCTGPHLPHSGRIKAFKITKNSAAYWLGNNQNDDLQRVYGVAFPKSQMLKDYIKIQEELAKRDHRNIGQTYDLFQFNPLAPGCAFFYPKGAAIYNKLLDILKHQYRIRGYQEVITPNLYDAKLWKISGHWTKYKENMFLVKGDNPDDQHGFKPMNCPGHCLMFDMKHVSYKDLPMRFADFGVLHRNELSGALSGLTRVRRFCQDDGHIFCMLEQVSEEIFGVLDFISYIYGLFGFKFSLGLSTRPDNFLGEVEQWDQAEEALRQGLLKFGKPFKINAKDGAFYGPKIDIELFDAFGRGFQCGTIQLDFQLPIRFNLQYKAPETQEQVKQDKEHPHHEGVPLLQKEKAVVDELQKQADEEEKLLDEGLDKQTIQKLTKKEKKALQRESIATVLKGNIKKKSSDQLDSLSEEQSQSQSMTQQTTTTAREKKYQIQEHHVKPGYQRPVIIHRAVMGSFERFLAILCEQTAGKWPFWLSPRQIIILPITKYQFEYAEKLQQRFELEGFNVTVDKSCHKIDKMVRTAQINQYNYIVCVGKKEEGEGTVDIRDRDEGKSIGKYSVADSINFFHSKQPEPCRQEKELLEKAYFGQFEKEFKELNEELQFKVYLEGEGFELGQRDKDSYNLYKDAIIDKKLYPNLFRWFQFVQKDLKE